ncbi:arabinofuranosyltransferase, partial [Bacteroides fragilis]|nr:arabinofuranosyltransferase [Bacteroides fragilis]
QHHRRALPHRPYLHGHAPGRWPSPPLPGRLICSATFRAEAPLESAAQHYLPEEGTQIPVPFLSFSIIGALCLIGLIYMAMRLEDGHRRRCLDALSAR